MQLLLGTISETYGWVRMGRFGMDIEPLQRGLANRIWSNSLDIMYWMHKTNLGSPRYMHAGDWYVVLGTCLMHNAGYLIPDIKAAGRPAWFFQKEGCRPPPRAGRRRRLSDRCAPCYFLSLPTCIFRRTKHCVSVNAGLDKLTWHGTTQRVIKPDLFNPSILSHLSIKPCPTTCWIDRSCRSGHFGLCMFSKDKFRLKTFWDVGFGCCLMILIFVRSHVPLTNPTALWTKLVGTIQLSFVP